MGTKDLVQISLYSNIIQGKEVSNFATLELFEPDYKHPTILSQNDNAKLFNYFLGKILLHALLIVAKVKY